MNFVLKEEDVSTISKIIKRVHSRMMDLLFKQEMSVNTNVLGHMRTLPESTINRIPSMVMEVSAMLVETIHFLTPSGDTSNTCW